MVLIMALFSCQCSKKPLDSNQAPSVPIAIEPEHQVTGWTINPTLVWSCTDPDGDPMTYDVYFGQTVTPVLVSSAHTDTVFELASLNYSTKYYWKIVAKDNQSHSTSSPTWEFTTMAVANQPPPPPSNPFPVNHATNQEFSNLTLYWDCTDPDSNDTLTFDVYFGIQNPPPRKTVGQIDKSYSPGPLQSSTLYNWKIVAKDNHGNAVTGSIWQFTTRGTTNVPPEKAQYVTPVNGATQVPIDPTLTWTCTDADGDPLTYDVYFGTSSPPPLVDANRTSTTYALGALIRNTFYHWRIIARDSHGDSSTSDIWSFTTESPSLAGTWSPLGAGTDDLIYTMTLYDNKLIVGGDFWEAGYDLAYGVASWNGSAWQPFDSTEATYALAVYNSSLYAAHDYSVEKWQIGSGWTPLGTDIRGASTPFFAALTVFGNNLVAGGGVDSIGALAVNKIAQWNGSAWSAFGAGLNAEVVSLCVYDGKLVAGTWESIFIWTGSTWTELGGGIQGPVLALAVYDNKLIAGGNFNRAGAGSVSNIAAWDGTSWSALTSGIGNPSEGVLALTEYDGKLFAGGLFSTAGGVAANSIAAWDGSLWWALGEGISGEVWALTVYGNELIIAGGFSEAGGVANAFNIARWKP